MIQNRVTTQNQIHTEPELAERQLKSKQSLNLT